MTCSQKAEEKISLGFLDVWGQSKMASINKGEGHLKKCKRVTVS